MADANQLVPRIAVLLATHNSEAWLREQLSSIAAQQGVDVTVHASDDASTDATVTMLAQGVAGLKPRTLPDLAAPLGSANRNFLRLIRDTNVADADYIALSDHDDVWLPTKLLRAVRCLRSSGCDAYSSSVTAFWADGRERAIVKSQPQRSFDFCFESPGPGCTFVFTREAFSRLQPWVKARHDVLAALKAHDWLIYAHAREGGWRWFIDSQSHMRYRQHGRNEIGANAGWRAALMRWRQVRNGTYRRDILAIAEAVNHQSDVIGALRRLSMIDRLRLATRAFECRRSGKEAAALAIFFLMMGRHEHQGVRNLQSPPR